MNGVKNTHKKVDEINAGEAAVMRSTVAHQKKNQRDDNGAIMCFRKMTYPKRWFLNSMLGGLYSTPSASL